MQLLRPQLLDGAFLRANPGFLAPAARAACARRRPYGAGRSLDVPHEVVDLRLHEGAGLVALVGVHRVSVLSLPPSASLSAPTTDAADELGAMLGQLGLTEYAAPLRGLGYDHVHSLLRMNAAERQAMAKQVGMKPGHAQTLTMHLDGRLPPRRRRAVGGRVFYRHGQRHGGGWRGDALLRGRPHMGARRAACRRAAAE